MNIWVVLNDAVHQPLFLLYVSPGPPIPFVNRGLLWIWRYSLTLLCVASLPNYHLCVCTMVNSYLLLIYTIGIWKSAQIAIFSLDNCEFGTDSKMKQKNENKELFTQPKKPKKICCETIRKHCLINKWLFTSVTFHMKCQANSWVQSVQFQWVATK